MERAHENSVTARFRSRGKTGPLLVGILFIAFLLGMIIVGPFYACCTRTDTLRGEVYLSSAAVFFTLLLVNAFIRTSDILIDDTGVRWLIFGKERNKIRWADVKRIRVWKTPDFANLGPPVTGYSLDTIVKFRLPYSKNPPFVFNDKVEHVRELLDIINIYVRKYNIPILDRREKPQRQIAQL